MQNGKEVAIAYAGCDFNSTERNYSAIECEALALVEGIRKFQPYIQCRHFTIETDHSALHWLFNIHTPMVTLLDGPF